MQKPSDACCASLYDAFRGSFYFLNAQCGNDHNQSPQESYAPFMPNVLKVFLENGQTKSFKYDSKTTVKDVVCSLQEKLNISSTHHFCLMLQNMKNNVPGHMTLLDEHETLADIASRPDVCHFRCLFRVAFVPLDAYDLLKEDPVAFEYFYMQCCNDVVQERLITDMKYDTALRLAALHIQQHAVSNHLVGKISIKAIEKASGLDKFVAHSLIESMKSRDLRKMLSQFMKMNQSLTAPGQKQLTALQAKLHYMKIISELKTFGSRVFMVTLLDQKTEAMVLVGPRAGVSVVTNIKSYTLTQLADFHQIEQIKVTKEGENMQRIDLKVRIAGQVDTIGLGLLTVDAQNFVLMLEGYYHILVDRNKQIVERTVGKNTSDPDVPAYSEQHRVLTSPWAYPEDLVSEVVSAETTRGGSDDEDKIIDLSKGPPKYLDEGKGDAYRPDRALIGDKHSALSASLENISTSHIAKMAATNTVFEEEVTSFRGQNADESFPVLDSESLKQIPPSPISLVTFQASPVGRRGKPEVMSRLDSQLCQPPKTEITLYNGTPPSMKFLLRPGESSSDSSLLDSEASERQALLPDGTSRRSPSPSSLALHSGSFLSGPRLNGGLDPESDDTDSGGTPGESPAKKRLTNANLSVEHDQQSFGLHSPDMFSGSTCDLQNLGHSDSAGLVNSVYSLDSYRSQRLYYDPDIIDLTNFPPPDTPDNDSVLDFTELANCPPPIFSSNTSLANSSGKDSVDGPRSTVKFSRLERSASIGNCPDFLDDDIDALIAQFTIPPPPSSADSRNLSGGGQFLSSLSGTSQVDLSHLIIPPPPSSTTPLFEDSPLNLLDSGHVKPKTVPRHKRSSSLDLQFMQRAGDQLDAKTRSKSLDANQNNIHSSKPVPPPDLNVESTKSELDMSGESPATVSQKLFSLLQSLPNFSPDILNNDSASSSRLHHRSSSLDLTASQADFPFSSSSSMRTFNSVGNFSSHSSSLRLKPSSRKALSQSFEPLSKAATVRERSYSETRHGASSGQSPSKNSPSGSDSFASLKAKLKDYRDYLLNRSKPKISSHNEPGHSLTKLFTRRDSNAEQQKTTSADSNWELKEAKPSPSPGEPHSAVRDKTGTPLKDGLPVVRDPLGLHRSSLRPVSGSLVNQVSICSCVFTV
ncbi:FERM and PDZ domain-containing protein 4 [Bulinus truncatus]|nr:FERM and PDZ domain-containing protein 4 [Bulinus truncatus]